MINKWELTSLDYEKSLVMYRKEEIKPLNLENLFKGAIYCMLTVNENYPRLIKVYNRLLRKKLLDPDELVIRTQEGILEEISDINYAITKSKRIKKFSLWWKQSYLPDQLLKESKEGELGLKINEFELRNEIAKPTEAPGLGFKCASLWMRMCGYKNVVPLDKQMIKFLHAKGYSVRIPDFKKESGITKTEYLQWEKWFTEIAKKAGVEPAMYQLALWCRVASWKKTETEAKKRQLCLGFQNLFVVLFSPIFEDYKFNDKTYEIRKVNNNFNEKTVVKKKQVVLSKGYSGERIYGNVGKVVIGSIDDILDEVYFKNIMPRTLTDEQAKNEITDLLKPEDEELIAFEVKF